MANTHPDGTVRHEIRVRGRLDPRWSGWFDGCAITAEPDGTTRIEARGLDQAGLHGLLTRVRDAGLQLVSVAEIGSTPD